MELKVEKLEEKDENGCASSILVCEVFGVVHIPMTHPEAVLWLRDNFATGPFDVFVCAYPKCGTTLCLKVCMALMHCFESVLCVPPHLSFYADISDIAAKYIWPENALSQGYFAPHRSDSHALCSERTTHLTLSTQMRKHSTDGSFVQPQLGQLNWQRFLRMSAPTANGMKYRFFKSHSWPHMFPCVEPMRGKRVFVVREFKDALVSAFHFYSKTPCRMQCNSFAVFFDWFRRGQLPWGFHFDYYFVWFQHLQRSGFHSDDNSVLWLYYEEFLTDLDSVLLKLLRFFELESLLPLLKDEFTVTELFARIRDMCSFEAMQSEALANPKSSFLDFFRKGVVGDWKSHFSRFQRNWADRMCFSWLRDTSLINLDWDILPQPKL